MTRTLYYAPGSCALAPHILLEEVGDPYQVILVSTDAGQTRSEPFHRLNSKARVPVLTEGDWTLTEASAISLHIATSSPSAMLMPDGVHGLVRAIEWTNWLATVHATAVRMIWRPLEFVSAGSTAGDVVAHGHSHLANAFQLIESRLEASEWAVGTRYSYVDAYILVFYRWGNRMHLDMRTTYPQWTRHTERLLTRPAVQRALEAEGISVWA